MTSTSHRQAVAFDEPADALLYRKIELADLHGVQLGLIAQQVENQAQFPFVLRRKFGGSSQNPHPFKNRRDAAPREFQTCLS
jgi:hypothetical protein